LRYNQGMQANPYESSAHVQPQKLPASRSRRATYALLWLVCFPAPTFAVAIAQRTPETIWGGLPGDGDNVLTRLSRCLRVRADLPLLVSFVGCTVLTAFSGFRQPWKAALILAWFPLVLLQLFAILFTLVASGRLSV